MLYSSLSSRRVCHNSLQAASVEVCLDQTRLGRFCRAVRANLDFEVVEVPHAQMSEAAAQIPEVAKPHFRIYKDV